MGNIAVAYTALGEINGLKEIRRVVSNSTELKNYEPADSDAWDKPYQDYLKILNK